ncbi:MAG: transporter substrate-binding domain-containing protein [Vulcanimicrobiaceae bacterium]
MRKIGKIRIGATLLAAVVGCSAALGMLHAGTREASAQSTAQESLLKQVLARGTLRVATTTVSPPFEFIDKDGQLAGFDIDIAHLIAKALFNDPNKVEFVRTSFDARWDTVNSGRADFGIMNTTIYPARLLNAAFTEGYIDSGNGCLVKKGSAIKNFADINRPNVTVALLNIEPDRQRKQEFFPKAHALFLTSQAAQYEAVLSGQAEAACTDRPFLAWQVKQHPTQLAMLSGTTKGSLNNAIFLKQGDFEWWLYLDTMVHEMKHGSLYTDYNQIYEKWLGEHAPPERP